MRILTVDDDDLFRKLMAEAFRSFGHTVTEAADGESALAAFERHRPDITFLDVGLPGIGGLELLARIRELDAGSIVVIVTGSPDASHVVEALRLHANEYLVKPFELKTLRLIVERFARWFGDRDRRANIERCVAERRLSLRLPNETEVIAPAVDLLVAEASGRIPPDRVPSMHLGLEELLCNAIEHGNLGISYEEKTNSLSRTGAFAALVAGRAALPELRERRVHVELLSTPDACEWRIRDEGEGFDWRRFAEATEPPGVSERHGRGIFLSKFQFDELAYLGCGNEVRVRLSLSPP